MRRRRFISIHHFPAGFLSLSALLLASDLKAADTSPSAPQSITYTDSMMAADGGKLNGRTLGDGKTAWKAQGAFVVSPTGATSSNAGGGWATFPIQRINGKYLFHAEIDPGTKGSVFIGLGTSSLGVSAFGSEVEVGAGMSSGGYEISASGTKIKFGRDKDYGGDRPGGNTLDLEVDMVAGTITARINDKVLVDASPQPYLNTLRIAKAGFVFYGPVNPNGSFIKNVSVQLIPAPPSANSPTVGLTPVSMLDFYILPNTDSTVRWKADLVGSKPEDAYEISDYAGKLVTTGKAQVAPDGTVSASLKLPAGFYELRFPETNEAFGVLSIVNPPATADPYFDIDAGLSSLTGTGSDLRPEDITPARREGYIDTMKRLGMGMARERMSIGSIARAPGIWSWETEGRPYDSVRKLYADNHIPILEMMWGSTKELGISKINPYPQVLPALAKTWEAIADRYHSNWAGTEIWNEPDLIAIPADQYVPMVKTISYAYQQGNINTPIVAGVFAKVQPIYFRTCLANGMLDACDVISFHHYDNPEAMLGFVSGFRAGLKEAGKEAMPLWISESGKPWGPGKSRAPIDKDSATGLNIAGKAFEGRAVGVARYCPFYLVPWGNPKNFGMTDLEGTPQRSLGAYAYCIAALSWKTYRGDLDAPGTLLARVFGDDKTLVAALYTNKIDPAATVKLAVHPLRVEGIDGRSLAVGADGSIPVPDGLSYVWLDPATALKTQTDATALYAISRQPAPARSVQAPIILQNGFDLSKVTHSAQRYLLDPASAQSLAIPAQAWNLSDQPVQATLHLELPGGIAVADADKTITVPPSGSVTTTWTVDASKALDVAETRFIRVSGKTSTGAVISPLAIPLMIEGDLATHLARHSIQDRLPVENLKLWKPNLGTGTMKMSADGTTWRFDYTPTGPANWVFPQFNCGPLDPKKYTGLLVRARVLKPANHISLGVRYGNGAHGGFEVVDIIPADGAWHVVYLPFTDFIPEGGTDQNAALNVEQVGTITTGFVSGTDNAMEISDLIAVGGTR
jgi:hypothetical protein